MNPEDLEDVASTPEVEEPHPEVDPEPGPEAQAEADQDNDFSLGLGLRKAVVVNKPDISALPPAVVDGKFTPEIGERVVMEVNAGKIWLHTRQYRVLWVDPASGNVGLMNDDLGQHAGYNFKTGPKIGMDMRYAPRVGRGIGSKRRGRPPKDPTGTKAPPPPVQYDADGNEVKRKRGRPRKVSANP